MTAFITTMSFTLTMMTNTVVLFGIITLFYLLNYRKQRSTDTRKRHLTEFFVVAAYDAYLLMMSILNGLVNAQAYGDHWTYLNMLVLSGFMFALLMQSWWHWAWVVSFRVIYLVTYGMTITPEMVLMLFALILIQTYLTGAKRERNGIDAKEWLWLIPYAFTSIMMIRLLTPGRLDAWFWVRQTGALGMLALVAGLYLLILVRLRDRTFEFRREATIDRMTGAKNFGMFNSDLQKYFRDFQAHGTHYAIYEIDIDNFKDINDTYGHPAGNTVLKRVVEEVRLIARGFEYNADLYRMGGEEFCLVLKDIVDDTERGKRAALLIKQRVSELRFFEDGDTFSVTVSIGQDRITAEDTNYLDIYNRVDKYLYQSKVNGRNAITMRGETIR